MINREWLLLKLLLIGFFLSSSLFICAQESLLHSEEHKDVWFVERLHIDAQKENRKTQQAKGGAYQFAIPFQVEYGISIPVIETPIRGYYHYIVQIEVPEAYAINFTLQGLKKSGIHSAYVKNLESAELLEPFNPSKNSMDLTPFPIIYSNRVMIEIVSKVALKKGDVDVYRVGATFEKAWLNNSEACEVDVACPQAELYSDIKRSVVRLLIDNMWLCTGTILNNTAEDQRPFLLTANHCVDNPMSAANTVFYFNYESPTCDGAESEYPLENTYMLRGASLRATKNDYDGALDFALLELNSMIPEDFNAYFAGWSASNVAPNYSIAIHHPAGDVKKISFDYDAAISGNFGNEYDENSHWRILKWDLGVTEGGSSGSAIFNSNKQVVGDLTGGEATCDYPYNDFYSKFSYAFDYYSDSADQLKYWLDPLDMGVSVWDGFPIDTIQVSIGDKKAYPNPASGYFFVSGLPISEEYSISIYALDGVMVYTDKFSVIRSQTRIDYPDELSGLFVVKLHGGEGDFEQLMRLF